MCECDNEKESDFLNSGVELNLKTLRDFFTKLTFIANHDLHLPFLLLHIDGFGLEDIWEQIELVNKPTLSFLHKHVKGYNRRQLQNLLVDDCSEIIANADEEVATCSCDNVKQAENQTS